LNIDYISQLSKKDFQWCKRYRYDFYIEKINTIIEVHGLQHYQGTYRFKTYEDIHQNDINKMNNAIENGIDNYIIIDAKKSDLKYLKNSILNSELNELYNLGSIDWDVCIKVCETSLKIDACNYWNDGLCVQEISELLNKNHCTIRKYLREMALINLCDYSAGASMHRSYVYNCNNSNEKTKVKKEYTRLKKKRKVKNINTGIIYDSLIDANKSMNKKENSQQIYKCCQNYQKTAYGYCWEFVY
jgi:hypothetical protein